MKCEYNNAYEDIRINICTKYKQDKVSTINKCIEEAIKRIPENIKNHLTKNKFEINVISKRDLNTKMYLEYKGITNKEKRKIQSCN